MQLSKLIDKRTLCKKDQNNLSWIIFGLIILIIPFINQLFGLLFIPQLIVFFELYLIFHRKSELILNTEYYIFLVTQILWVLFAIAYHVLYRLQLVNSNIYMLIQLLIFALTFISLANLVIAFRLRRKVKQKIKYLNSEIDNMTKLKYIEEENKRNNLYEEIFGIVK